MDFELTDAQQEIVRGVRALCQRFPDEYWRDKDARHEFPQDFYKAVAEAGFLGIAIPEEYGGSGLGITEAALVMREVAYMGAMNAASSIHLGILGWRRWWCMAARSLNDAICHGWSAASCMSRSR